MTDIDTHRSRTAQAAPETGDPWQFAISELGDLPSRCHVVADEETRRAAAARLALPALHALAADLVIQRESGAGLIHVTGRLEANVRRSCVVTLEPFDAEITDEIDLFFAAAGHPPPHAGGRPRAAGPGETREEAALKLGADMPEGADDVPEALEGETLDLMEIAIQHLSLALDPHPRAPGASLEAWQGTVISEEEAAAQRRADSPFAALAALKPGGGEGPEGKGGG